MFDDHAVPKNQTPKKIYFFRLRKFSFFFHFATKKIRHFQKLPDVKKSKIENVIFETQKSNFFELEKNKFFSELNFLGGIVSM